eukprot:763624-Hanusia_phi.AAC.4
MMHNAFQHVQNHDTQNEEEIWDNFHGLHTYCARRHSECLMRVGRSSSIVNQEIDVTAFDSNKSDTCTSDSPDSKSIDAAGNVIRNRRGSYASAVNPVVLSPHNGCIDQNGNFSSGTQDKILFGPNV